MLQPLILVLSLLATDGPLAIRDVNVIDVTTGEVRPLQTVLVNGHEIAQVAPTADVKIPADATTFDGRGKYLIPGLWDMHVHFASADYAPLFVANGVVGVRDMHAHLPFMLLPLRKMIADGKKIGPQIITAISMVDGAPPMWGGTLVASNAEEGRKAVQTLKSKGADFVKVYSGLGPDAFHAICDEAEKTGLPVVGHVPEAVSALEGSNAGVRSMEHIFGILMATSANESALRPEFVASIRGVDAKTFYAMLIRAQLKALDSYNAEQATNLFATFQKNQTYQCPTMTVHRMFASLTDPTFTADPRARYTPQLIRINWKQALGWITPIAENKEDQKKLYDKTKEIVGTMHKAGVPILAGTDVSNPYCYAGFSLHDELALLVESGLSPLAALQAATIVPARFLMEEERIGSVVAGKEADLVLLDDNPLSDIRNTQKIHAVLLDGKLLDRAALDDLLSKAEQAAAGKRAAK